MITAAEPLYRWILRPILFQLNPETAHRLTLRILARLPRRDAPPDPPELGQNIRGLAFSNPIGLAAGMDKDLAAPLAWQWMGFAFAELGTVTPRPQPGNPRPRLWRLPAERALVNRLGFPSKGMEAALDRLRWIRTQPLQIKLGLNFGPNRETEPGGIADDCATLMAKLGPLADFVVVNLSSPNTPGLRDWQDADRMERLFGVVMKALNLTGASAAEPQRPRILVKIAPDLDTTALESICQATARLHLDGIVATNTSIARAEPGVAMAYPGGLSGEPLKSRAREIIRQVYRFTSGRIPIIGVGGVASAEDAYEHIRAGASLIEIYTGLIYEGPGLPQSIKSGLLKMLGRDGFRSIGEAVGTSV